MFAFRLVLQVNLITHTSFILRLIAEFRRDAVDGWWYTVNGPKIGGTGHDCFLRVYDVHQCAASSQLTFGPGSVQMTLLRQGNAISSNRSTTELNSLSFWFGGSFLGSVTDCCLMLDIIT